MISLPDDRVTAATIQGVDERYAKVSNFGQAVWWRPIDKANAKDANGQDPRLDPLWPQKVERDFQYTKMLEGHPVEQPPPGSFRSWEQMYKDGLRLMVTDPKTGQDRPGH
jgi:hypothetical protein